MEIAELLTSLTPAHQGGFQVTVPEDWQQGRTLYGGLNAAFAAQAAARSTDGLGPLRALQIAFMAPAAGTVRYAPTILRAGRSVSFIGVDTLVGDTLCSRSILTYAHARESPLVHLRVEAPRVPPVESCPEVPYAPGITPIFLQHMEMRFAAGDPPLSGGEPEFTMWARHRNAAGLDPTISLVAMADLLPPAVVSSRREFRPASSVTWTLDTAEVPADPGDWYLMTTRSDAAAGGYSTQGMSCFGYDGRLAAIGRQTVAAF